MAYTIYCFDLFWRNRPNFGKGAYKMLYVPIEYLKPGMRVARDICSYPRELHHVCLLSAGQTLTESNIRRIGLNGVAGAYIRSSGAKDEDLSVPEMINETLRTSAINEIRAAYDDFGAHAGGVSQAHVELLADICRQLVESILRSPDMLFNMMDLKNYDDYTYRHCLSVSIYSTLTGVSLGFSTAQLEKLALSGMLHDLGKARIPRWIINKPDKLTEEEYDVMRRHPDLAVEMLPQNMAEVSPKVMLAVGQHHERFDGQGYPKGLQGENISLYGRILAAADVYDALVSKRPYRRALMPSEAVEYIMANAGTHFDPAVVDAFLHSVVAYPTGVLVRLSSGEQAVVVRNYRANTLRPVVRIVSEGPRKGRQLDLLNDRACLSTTITGVDYSGEDWLPGLV